MGRISIITINYNDARGLERTLASIRRQGVSEAEVIVVDGGSNDDSLNVIQQNVDIITHWSSEKDTGIYNAQNKGASKATGQHLLFMNSGDWFESDSVLSTITSLITDADTIYYGDARLHDERGIYADKIHPPTITGYYLMKETVCHQSQFIPRTLFRQMNGYDESYRIVADYEFFTRAFFRRRVNTVYLCQFISVFDTTGVSSSPDMVRAIMNERQRVRKMNAPLLLRLVYEIYAAVMQSEVMKRSGVAALLGSIKNKLTGN